jgi:hypothetical protein
MFTSGLCFFANTRLRFSDLSVGRRLLGIKR